MADILYSQNDMVVKFTGLQSAVDGTFVNDAVLSLSLYDKERGYRSGECVRLVVHI